VPVCWTSIRLDAASTRRADICDQAHRSILGIVTRDLSEAEPEAFVLMESTASRDDVEAVRKVLREAGLDLPVHASWSAEALVIFRGICYWSYLSPGLDGRSLALSVNGWASVPGMRSPTHCQRLLGSCGDHEPAVKAGWNLRTL
jgi:hypothetical protein